MEESATLQRLSDESLDITTHQFQRHYSSHAFISHLHPPSCSTHPHLDVVATIPLERELSTDEWRSCERNLSSTVHSTDLEQQHIVSCVGDVMACLIQWKRLEIAQILVACKKQH
jgi:hypothetical protein